MILIHLNGSNEQASMQRDRNRYLLNERAYRTISRLKFAEHYFKNKERLIMANDRIYIWYNRLLLWKNINEYL